VPPENPTTDYTAPILGTYKGRPIPEWVDAPERGGLYLYDRIAIEESDGSIALAQLRSDEFVVCPGLIYRMVS
jgi:hypothetical protein